MLFKIFFIHEKLSVTKVLKSAERSLDCQNTFLGYETIIAKIVKDVMNNVNCH